MVDDKIKPEDENEETVIELEGEETEEASAEPVEHEDRVEAKADDDELENYSESVQKRINRLTKKMREAERREQEALTFAQKVKSENDNLRGKVKQLDSNYSSEYENRVTSQLDAVKRAYKEAYESGDVDRMAEAQQLMAKITIDQERLRVYRENRKDEEPALEEPKQETRPAAPREPDPKAQAWAEKNEWFGSDERMTNAAFITHRELVDDEGFDPSSDEYYDELDRRMRRDFPHKFSANDESKPAATKPAQTVASASRKPTSNGRKSVKLSKSQVEIARRLGVPLEEYARYVKEA
jgi:hypothetical protein